MIRFPKDQRKDFMNKVWHFSKQNKDKPDIISNVINAAVIICLPMECCSHRKNDQRLALRHERLRDK